MTGGGGGGAVTLTDVTESALTPSTCATCRVARIISPIFLVPDSHAELNAATGATNKNSDPT